MRRVGPSRFGELLRQHRLALRLTQEELAERAQLSVRGISDLERGGRTKPQRETLRLLAGALNLSEWERSAFVDAARGPMPSCSDTHAHRPTGGFLGAIPTVPLIARQEELQRIVVEIVAVAEGEGRLVLLTGEPGIGKTRMAQEVTRELLAQRFLVATGRCYENLCTLPYAPFLEALATAFASAPDEIQCTAGQRWPYLSRLLPDQLEARALSPLWDQAEEHRLLRAVTGFLQAIGDHAPVALLLDDLHWADSASLDLLLHLARHTRRARILLLASYRAEEVVHQPQLKRIIHDLGREQLQTQVALRRLDRVETADFLGAFFGMASSTGELTQFVHRHTEGNPFFIREMLRALVERGDIYQENGNWRRHEIERIAVPENIRSTIEERVSRLGLEAQQFLEEASVLGHTFLFSDVCSMGNRGEEEADAVLDEVLASGLVYELDTDSYGFNHVLTQQALYARLRSHRMRTLHVAAGETLERVSELHRESPSTRGASEIARHFLEGGQPTRALPHVIVAGDGAERVFAHSEAELHYRTALRIASNSAREAEVLEKLSVVLRIMGQYDDALELLERSAALHSACGDASGEMTAVAQIGRVHVLRGHPEQGVIRLQPLLAELETYEPSIALAAFYVALAKLYVRTGEYGKGLSAAVHAGDLAQVLGDDNVLAEVKQEHANALAFLGRVEEGLRVHEEAILRAEAVGDMNSLCANLHNVSHMYLLQGEFELSMLYKDRGLAAAERLGDPVQIIFQTFHRVFTAFYMCEWSEGRRQYERGEALARQVGVSYLPVFALLVHGLLLYGQGDRDTASHDLEECSDIARRTGEIQVLRLAQRILAERDVLEGRPDEACARLIPLLDRHGVEERDVTFFLPVLARAYLELGEQTRADEMIGHAVRRARAGSLRLMLVEALSTQTVIASRRRRWKVAEDAVNESVALARSIHYQHGEARALYAHGLLNIEQGELPSAHEHMREALALFEHLGTLSDVERTKKTLAVLEKA